MKLRRNYGTTELQIDGTTENWLCFATPRQRTEAMPRLQDNESTSRAVAGTADLRNHGITEASLCYAKTTDNRQRSTVVAEPAQCSVLTAQSLYAFRLLPLNLSREATRSLVDS